MVLKVRIFVFKYHRYPECPWRRVKHILNPDLSPVKLVPGYLIRARYYRMLSKTTKLNFEGGGNEGFQRLEFH